MKVRPTRRDLLRSGVGLGAGLVLVPGLGARPRSANDRLDLGVIGVGGRGAANLAAVAGENVVALCDVDEERLIGAGRGHPRARTYQDFRVMLERERLDAVVISTPDHTHAPATLAALDLGLDVYCEKPLTHSVAEARRVTERAREQGAVTQMGTQIHAGSNYRRVVERVRSGVLGTVVEVHVFCGKGWWAPALPAGEDPVPRHLDWDLWLGPARELPYHASYHPANWRRYWNFGGGTLGDMACHYVDLPFWALELDHPTRVASEGPPPHPEGTPEWVHCHWSFPGRVVADGSRRGPVELHWYDGGKRPALLEELGVGAGNGVVFVGERGALFADYGSRRLLPAEDFTDHVAPAPWIPDSIGHHAEWIRACKERGPTTCAFDYAGALTETVLLGAVAFRAGAALAWDAATLEARVLDGGAQVAPGALGALIDRPWRDGWA